MKKIIVTNFTILLLITALMPVLSPVARAQETQADPSGSITNSLNDIGATIDLPNASPRTVTLNIIRWVLGMLGLIAVTMIIYGGFTWMTAGGNEKRVETAKNVLTYSVIGMVVILLSWAMVSFFINRVADLSS